MLFLRLLTSALLAAPLASATSAVTSEFAPWVVVSHDTPAYVPEQQGRVDVWRLRRSSGGEPVTFALAIFPAQRNRTSIAYVDRMGTTSRVYAPGFCDGSIAVTNANFFTDTHNRKRPLGLLKIGGNVVTRASSRKTGGFLIVNGRGQVSILPKRSRAAAERAHNVLESSPILILAGKDDMRGDQRDKFDRVAVGNTRAGDTVLAGAFANDQRTMSLAEFSTLILKAAARKSVELDGMLAMDGGPSAHLWFPQSNVLMGHRGTAYLPSAVCVSSR